MDHQSSTPFPRNRLTRMGAAVALCVFVALAASACGGSADIEDAGSTVADAATSQPSDTSEPADTSQSSDTSDTSSQNDEADEEDTQPSVSESSGPAGISSGTFELVLDNGETFTAPVQCALEPEIAAGSEILFSVVGTNEGRLYDVTQWGETSFGGTQSVEVVDATSYDDIWRATGSTGLVLELNGNVISGSGGFYPGEELNGPKTQGEVTVTC